jgi:hypothetical protein
MSYLLTGTSVNSNPVSNYAPGINQKGQDYVAQTINGTGNLTLQAGYTNAITTSIVNHNFVGAAIYVLGTSGTTPKQVQVNDVMGQATGNYAVIVSGTAGVTINGSTTSTISTAYGSKTYYNWSGNAWVAI